MLLRDETWLSSRSGPRLTFRSGEHVRNARRQPRRSLASRSPRTHGRPYSRRGRKPVFREPGLSGQAWATYGGGACFSCAPVVPTQCNVVTLVPQVQTVYAQTVYETVYENEAYTVMQTRYKQAYKTENVTVMKPVMEEALSQVQLQILGDRSRCTRRPTIERKYTVCKPVYTTERREQNTLRHPSRSP